MDNVLSRLSWEVYLYYLDDIIVFLRGWHEHIQQLRMVFQRLREANLRLGHKKCTLARTSIIFHGHLVSEEGLRPNPRLPESIREIQPPTSMTQVRSFLGLVGYHRTFTKGFSKVAVPLIKLLEKNRSFVWTTKCMEAYNELKELLLREPVAAYPDFSVPFRLYTDVSNIGLRAILAQKQERKEDNLLC